jgi:cytochrome bd-type quinol oxidase subunit 2
MTMTKSRPERLELQQRVYLMSRTQRWGLWAIVLVMLALLAVIVTMTLYRPAETGRDGAALMTKLVRNPVDAVLNALMLVVLVLQLGYLRLAQQRERLILTPAGIEYRSPLPDAWQALRPSWSLAWGQIHAAVLQGARLAHDARGVALEFDNGLRKYRIFPFQWVDPAQYQPASPWKGIRKLVRENPEQIFSRLEESAVLRYIAAAAPHLSPRRGAFSADVRFALDKNPRALAVVVAFFALFFYALGDTFIFGHETYVEQPPYPYFIAAGILAAIATAVGLRRAQVPIAESLGVALLFGGALGAAFYPGALRVNALTDAHGLRNYEYQLGPALTLSPLSDGLPTLAFPRYADYWSYQKAGSVHSFELRRGGFGFYQINMHPVEQTLHDFYENQNGVRNAAGR